MIIQKICLDVDHWSSKWIPISYKTLSKKQYNNSYTFLWHENNEVLAICRSYYMSKHHIEIGDVWLNEKCRGKYQSNIKISILFMKKIIAKIWKIYSYSTKISLVVSSNNIPAIKLYQKLNFHKTKNTSDEFYMIRKKRLL
jgi:hypothetical protein